MSLNFNIEHENDIPPIVPLFQSKTGIGLNARSASPPPILIINLKSVSDFFQKYEIIGASYSTNVRMYLDSSQYLERTYCISGQASELKTMQIAIDAAKSMINDEPTSAMSTLDIMISQVFSTVERKRVGGTGALLLKRMLAEMSSEIQDMKNEINCIQEKRGPLTPRCTASPIFIPLKL